MTPPTKPSPHSHTLGQVSRSTMAAVMTMEPAALSVSAGSPNGSGIQWQDEAAGGYESSPECQVNFTGHWRVSGSPSKPWNTQCWPHRDDERLALSLILQAVDLFNLFNNKTPFLNFCDIIRRYKVSGLWGINRKTLFFITQGGSSNLVCFCLFLEHTLLTQP